ncbi:hypothetical protein KIPB_008513 [Kipferlia bialata]|uniref:Uncharacterized protein n=1 Tax=Kipferlia bialata TaxID=797122 RepID=A0A9K3D0U1_9EUKA|nr:hypothetical protein KIPB_008513 [Kipferlia bialata]|eukprot:g8513.t1
MSGYSGTAVQAIGDHCFLAATNLGGLERFTVDPDTLKVTSQETVLEDRTGVQYCHCTLMRQYNATLMVCVGITVEVLENGDVVHTPQPMDAYKYNNATGAIRRRRAVFGDGPPPLMCYQTGFIGGTLVMLRGYESAVSHPNGGFDFLAPNTSIWMLDMNTWKGRRCGVPGNLAKFLNDKASRTTGMITSQGGSLVAFCKSNALHICVDHTGVSFQGEQVIVSNSLADLRVRPTAEVDIGPYVCLFRRETRRHTTEGWESNVYMYDRVSGEAAKCVSLPYPDRVDCACMLNPTTMLVVLRERTLVVELDPCLFQRFSDAD